MSKKMLINATLPEENRVAIVEDGILTELDIEVAGHEQAKGNIYKAVVVRVEPGLQAAFVDYGAERLGFLQIDEINFKHIKPKNQENGKGRPRINDLLNRGQELLVQVIKEERGNKGAALTTYLSLAGRYMVLMPDSTTRGVSRKAENDAQRKQLKKAMASLELPDKFGYIVRTAALDQTREELERDSHYLMRLYDSICALDEKTRAPSLIYKETNLVIRSIRDYFTTDMDEVLIDDPDVFKEAKNFFQVVMPDYAGLVKLHLERRPIFSRYQIEDQIETISTNKVALPSGGSIVIDTTEALVAIDVNSGKMATEQGVEATATKTNLEAAREVARQLRLRDLGGLVVIDFIDMRDRKHNRQVEEELGKAMANDKARVTVGKISQFGLLELSRQRIRGALAEGAYRPCPHCHGAGRIKSPETLAAALLRRIHAGVAKAQVSRVDAKLPLEVATYLLNNKRDELLGMERRYNVAISVCGKPDFLTDQVEIEFSKREKDSLTSNDVSAAEILKTLAEQPNALAEAKAVEDGKSEPSAAHDPPKKRRRRRPRKPDQASKAVEEGASSAETPLPAKEPQPDTADTDQVTAEQDKPGSSETGGVDKTKTTRKPRRRRSTRAKTETASRTTEAAEPAVETLQETKATLSSGDASEMTSSTSVSDPSSSDEQPKTPGDKEAKSQRRRPRRPRTQTKTADNAESIDRNQADAETVESSPPDTSTSEKSPQQKSRRTTRRQVPEKTDPLDQSTDRTSTSKPAESKDQADSAPAKPKRRRTPRKKPAKPAENLETDEKGSNV